MIYTPKIYGTCNGAKKALDLVYSLVDEGKKFVIYKDILHNSRVIDDLKKVGVECISDLEELTDAFSVVIRAHGEKKFTYDLLESKNIHVYDATCPNVLKIHDIIKVRYEKGFSIIIIGKKNHPEVIGSNGWCDDNALIIETEEDVNTIKKLNDNTLIICQTTISTDMYEKFSEKITTKFPNINFERINTVCLAQKAIQNSSVMLAKKMDYTFVIGGEKSSNTRELYNLCSKYCKCYMFSDLNTFFEFIKKEKGISSKSKICITGGASTPVYLIDEYISFLEFYLDYKEKISLFNNSIEALNVGFLSSKEEKDVVDAISKFISLNSGGKYVRAYLIDLGYRVFGKKKNYAIPLSLSYEFFQTAILIHDDIIDNAKERRGKKTIPVLYNEEFLKFSPELTKSMQTSNSLALCIGDLGYYYANKIIFDNYEHDKNLVKVFKYYNDIVINTIKGEIMDVILPFKEQFIKVNPNLDDILKIFELKTSWYSVVGPFCLGMTLAGKSVDEIKLYEQILLPAGIAFQIKDDLLGIYSDNSIVGKDSSDISEYKQTLLYYYTVKQDKYHDELLKYYGKSNLDKNDVDSVRKIFDDSGAKLFAIEMMNKLFDKARSSVSKLDISDRYKKVLLGFILYLEYRDK